MKPRTASSHQPKHEAAPKRFDAGVSVGVDYAAPKRFDAGAVVGVDYAAPKTCFCGQPWHEHTSSMKDACRAAGTPTPRRGIEKLEELHFTADALREILAMPVGYEMPMKAHAFYELGENVFEAAGREGYERPRIIRVDANTFAVAPPFDEKREERALREMVAREAERKEESDEATT